MGFSDQEEAARSETYHPADCEVGACSMFVSVLHHIRQRPYPRRNEVPWFHLPQVLRTVTLEENATWWDAYLMPVTQVDRAWIISTFLDGRSTG